MACTPSNLGLKIFEKYLLGGRGSEIFILVGGCTVGGGGDNFVGGSLEILKENLKMHNPSTKSIFKITSLTH